ncbi:hypothetical protein [Mesobacillus thioparans]|uniref:hypothetical protein n=1 Tax=Mesobacillus thioparans TaxID=370439 RepID=UPI0039EE85EC
MSKKPVLIDISMPRKDKMSKKPVLKDISKPGRDQNVQETGFNRHSHAGKESKCLLDAEKIIIPHSVLIIPSPADLYGKMSSVGK